MNGCFIFIPGLRPIEHDCFLKNNGQFQHHNKVNPLFNSLKATKFEKRALKKYKTSQRIGD
jgi:hypothetical protein